MGFLTQLEKLLDGKKTYLVALATGVAAALLSLHRIDQGQYDHFLAFAIPAFFAAIRSAIGNK